MASIPPLSAVPDARTRKTFGLLLQGIARVGGARVAEVMDVSESTVSREKGRDGVFHKLAELLTLFGYKPVPIEWKCVDPQEYAILKRWAIQRLEWINDEGDPTDIHWEDTRR